LAKIEQKLDYLIEKENFKIDIKDYPRFNKKFDSLLQKVLDETTWKRNHIFITEEGYNLNDVIQAGLDNPDHPIGLVSPSKDAYYTFEDILVTAAMKIHQRNLRLNKYEKENFPLLKNLILNSEEFLTSIILDLDLNTTRNIESYSFTSKISRSSRRDLARNLLQELKSNENEVFEEQGKFLSLEKALEISEQNPFFRSCGFYRDWPDGRFIYVNNNNTLSLVINEEDHIRLTQKSENEMNPKFVKHLINYFDLIEKLGSILNFSFDDYLGYLTSLPNNLGSGCYFKLKIKLPTQRLEEFENHFKNIPEVKITKIGQDKPKNDGSLNFTSIELSNSTSFYNFSQIIKELITLKDLFRI
jgi:hypothetical protein